MLQQENTKPISILLNKVLHKKDETSVVEWMVTQKISNKIHSLHCGVHSLSNKVQLTVTQKNIRFISFYTITQGMWSYKGLNKWR